MTKSTFLSLFYLSMSSARLKLINPQKKKYWSSFYTGLKVCSPVLTLEMFLFISFGVDPPPLKQQLFQFSKTLALILLIQITFIQFRTCFCPDFLLFKSMNICPLILSINFSVSFLSTPQYWSCYKTEQWLIDGSCFWSLVHTGPAWPYCHIWYRPYPSRLPCLWKTIVTWFHWLNFWWYSANLSQNVLFSINYSNVVLPRALSWVSYFLTFIYPFSKLVKYILRSWGCWSLSQLTLGEDGDHPGQVTSQSQGHAERSAHTLAVTPRDNIQ